jgi:MFS family permease
MKARRRWVISPLFVLCVAQFVLQLDFSVVNIALKTIQGELHFSAVGLQWVITGYGLTYGSLLLFGGRVGDRVGRRRMLIFGLALFAASSAACAVAGSPLLLVAPRMVQGLSAALVAPAVLALLTATYPDGAERTRALGFWTAATAGGAMAGIVLGGLMTEYLGWRSVFIINVPLVAVLIPLARQTLPESLGDRARDLDLAGSAAVTLALGGLIYGLASGEQRGFGATVTLVALIAAASFAGAFVALERRAAEPLLPFFFLAAPSRRTSILVLTVVSGVLGGYVYFVALAMQQVIGLSGAETSVAFLPGPIIVAVLSTFCTRRLIARFDLEPVLLVGIVLMAVGQFWLAQLSESSSYLVGIMPALFLTGSGAGLVLPGVAVGIASGVTRSQESLAGGLIPTAQQIGATAGVAVLATLAAGAASAHGGDLAVGYATGFAVSVALLTVLAAVVLITRPRMTTAKSLSIVRRDNMNMFGLLPRWRASKRRRR